MLKDTTKKLINDQLIKAGKEIDTIENVKDRAELRIKYAETLLNISLRMAEGVAVVKTGKDSIKEDTAKTQVVIEETNYEDITVEEVINKKESLTAKEASKAAMKLEVEEFNPDETEVAEEDEVVEEVVDTVEIQEEEFDEETIPEDVIEETIPEDEPTEPSQIIVQTEEGDDIDVTEVYNLLNPEISDDFRRDYALQIVEYGTLESYKTLDFIVESEEQIIGYKNLVAYWIDTIGLDTVEYYINYFASNIEVNEDGDETYVDEELHLDFLNDSNIKGFTEYVESLSDEE
jgi:hypothetical protein